MASADWYFDFISPFAYLQSEQLALLGPSVRVRYRPVLFAGLLNAHGQKGPAELPRKRVFTYRYLVWEAAGASPARQILPLSGKPSAARMLAAVSSASSSVAPRHVTWPILRPRRGCDLP